jgi:hypothetical protein
MTSFQLDPSAQAPWATTTVLFSGNGMSRFGNLGRLVIFGFIDFNFGLPVLSTCDLENNLQLDRRAEWKAGDAVNQPTWVLIFAKNPFQ